MHYSAIVSKLLQRPWLWAAAVLLGAWLRGASAPPQAEGSGWRFGECGICGGAWSGELDVLDGRGVGHRACIIPPASRQDGHRSDPDPYPPVRGFNRPG